MVKRLIGSSVIITAIGWGLALSVTTAQAHHPDDLRARFWLLFGSSGYNYVGYHGAGYYENGYYNNGYYNDGHYSGYHYFTRHVGHRYHSGIIRTHHRVHDIRICNCHVTKVY